MCGLVGVVKPGMVVGQGQIILKNMMNVLQHRGPDGEGVFNFQPSGVFLGHRRLAIIDPAQGQQPMTTDDGQLTVVFNGAIYNYLELRRELIAKGYPIHSYSDTEVLLYAYKEWGEKCVERFLGMFSFSVWDQANFRLFCARDRIGIKPFYYYFDGASLVFASEIKAILASGMVEAVSNTDGLQDYLTFQFCLGDKTLFQGIHKLQPGHCMVVQCGKTDISVKVHQYWDISYNVDHIHDQSWFIDRLAGLIDDATRMHLRSDVPLGAHLSGGLDSSTVVCLAAGLLKGERIKTFTGAFPEGLQFDETNYAKEVAAFANTDYHEIYIQGSDFSEVLPRLMYYMDEPVAGPGLIPQYYVSKLAAEHVKVVLGGQGGDEIFLGYARYLVAYLEKCLSGAIYQTAQQNIYAVTLDSIIPNLPLLQSYKPMLQGFWRNGLFETSDRRYFKLIDRSEGISRLFSPTVFEGDYSPFRAFQEIFNRDGLLSMINRMTYFDLKGSLPALLHVEDRTSMAVSIESRVPLLDHRIVEFMASIPPNLKFAGGCMKHLFKESVRNTIPKKIYERKDKMGFPTPLTQWTKGIAKDFVRDILFSRRVRQRGIYNVALIESALENESEYGRIIWGLLCLELWHRIFIDGDMKPNV